MAGQQQGTPLPAFYPGGAVLPLEIGKKNYPLRYAELMVISVQPPQKYALFLEEKKKYNVITTCQCLLSATF